MNNEQYQRELNIRKIVMSIIIAIIVITLIVIFSLYIAEESFRKWVDVNVLRKDVTSENVATIDLNVDKNNQIFCYNKYVCILNEKNLKLYNQSGENVTDIPVDINTAIFSANNKYLAIAEKNGQELCVILDKTYLWRQKIDGEILQIYINENGYVALVTTDTTYKSIITVYDQTGKQLMRNFLSTTRVIDVSISNDNKYVAFAEMDTSGTLIKSSVKVISIEKAQTKSDESLIYSKDVDTSKMIIKVKYQEKNDLICVYDDSVELIRNNEASSFVDENDNITFITGNLKNSVAYIEEQQAGVFDTTSKLSIINSSNNQSYTYNFDEIAKEMYANGNIIGVNIGTEMYFIKTNGMLIKKYTSNQEITNVLISDDLATIIYKDRIEIINL